MDIGSFLPLKTFNQRPVCVFFWKDQSAVKLSAVQTSITDKRVGQEIKLGIVEVAMIWQNIISEQNQNNQQRGEEPDQRKLVSESKLRLLDKKEMRWSWSEVSREWGLDVVTLSWTSCITCV